MKKNHPAHYKTDQQSIWIEERESQKKARIYDKFMLNLENR